MKNWNFRKGTLSDVPELIDFQQKMAFESEKMILPAGPLETGIRRVLTDASIGDYWILSENLDRKEAEDKLVACLLLQKEWSDWRAKWVYWIHSLYVIPEYRRRGVFRFMYEKLKEKIELDPDAAGIRLYVDLRNEAADRTYQRLGMNKEHYSLYEWLKDA